MPIESDPLLEVAHEGPIEIGSGPTPRDRRSAFRVSLPGLEVTCGSPMRLVDVSLSGVGFLARREDAPLLADARLLIHLNGDTSLRAEVQRVELGMPSVTWVRGGARFIDLGDEERAALSTLVTTRGL